MPASIKNFTSLVQCASVFVVQYFLFLFQADSTLHFLVIGLNGEDLSISLQSTLNCFPSSFNCQTWLARVELCLFLLFLKSDWCPLNLFLKVFPVTPVYVSVFPDRVSVTVALYITQSVLHLPWTVHTAMPPRQLQPGCWASICWLSCMDFMLCLAIACDMFGMHL